MPSIKMTEMQLSLSHILAQFFKHHGYRHDGTIDPKGCPYCEALDDLQCYIEAYASSKQKAIPLDRSSADYARVVLRQLIRSKIGENQ